MKDTTANFAWFFERCEAAEELAALGHQLESVLLWHDAIVDMDATLPATHAALRPPLTDLLREAEALPRERPRAYTAQHAAFRERARKFARAAHQALPTPRPMGSVLLVLGAALLCASVLTFAVRAQALRAFASAVYSSETGADKALDGDLESEWLLPNHSTGHLDVALPRRRAVREVMLRNGHNQKYLDRAIKAARLEVYDDDTLVDSVRLEFTGVEANPSARHVPLAGRRATRVRLVVESFFAEGAALAELDVR